MRLKTPRVFIRGVGLHQVNKDDHAGLGVMSEYAIRKALEHANMEKKNVKALVVGNMLAPVLQKQNQVAALCAHAAGLKDIDSLTVDVASGSGGAAFRTACAMLLSGFHDTVVVLGIERMIGLGITKRDVVAGLSQASDWDTEGSHGETFLSLNDRLHDTYCERYGKIIHPDDFFYVSENAHRNATTAGHAMLRKPLSFEQYQSAPRLGKRIGLFDACPTANGACALVLCTRGTLGQDPVVLGSACFTDSLPLSARADILALDSAKHGIHSVLSQANMTRKDVSLFEVHDAYTIMSILCLEVGGFCKPGMALDYVKKGHCKLNGELPISTFGGLKARGHAVGASGAYQIGEIALQLWNQAGENQVPGAKTGLSCSFGGAATTVATHLIGM